MTRIPLLCIEEEARAVIYRVLDAVRPEQPPRVGVLSYIQSRGPLGKDAGENTKVPHNQSVDSEFIGATEQECRQWFIDHYFEYPMLSATLLAIADARTARDGTIYLQYYCWEDSQFDFPPFGLLPQKPSTWYNYRIDVKGTDEVYTKLLFVELDVSFPTYFGRKEELTNAQGIFDTVKADRIICKDEPKAYLASAQDKA
ncbi:hypothetical protein IQ07DRAFT_686140 [Pyrenochaeta sp. DS3sAY3a]|nr:hypothetical protein IQ07DRAFT_686140 [Pyrenochaeta sp. DS3sAY3a]